MPAHKDSEEFRHRANQVRLIASDRMRSFGVTHPVAGPATRHEAEDVPTRLTLKT